jgi:hypothetical protein
LAGFCCCLDFRTLYHFVGYKIIRKSLSGIMDEQDPEILNQIIRVLEENRTEWIDVHNMKIQQFGANLHIDAHITLPGIMTFVMPIMKWKSNYSSCQKHQEKYRIQFSYG